MRTSKPPGSPSSPFRTTASQAELARLPRRRWHACFADAMRASVPVPARSAPARIWHSGGVERRVDLDQVAGLISRHAFAWEESGLMVGPLTWRDAATGWPSPLMEDRGQVVEPDSVGVAVRKDGQEGHLVVFGGGWADLGGSLPSSIKRRIAPMANEQAGSPRAGRQLLAIAAPGRRSPARR